MPDVLAKYKVSIKFDLKPIKGKLSDLIDYKFQTKKVTFERAQELAVREAKKVWPKFTYTITKIR